MKTIKEQLVKENARLTNRVASLERFDDDLRKNLTAILKYTWNDSYYGRKPETMTWYDICFHIGELRADANYSCVLEQVENLKRDLAEATTQAPNNL